MPSGTPFSVRERAKIEVNFVGPPHPPFFMQCQAALQVRVHSTTVVRFRYPRRSGLAELFVLCEGTILADDDVKTARYQYDLLGRGTVYWAIIYLFPFVSSRVSFSARLLFDVAASQVPSVAAAVVFLGSLSCRRRFWRRISAHYCCEERNFFIWSAVVALGLGLHPQRTILLQASPRRRLVEPERRRAVSSRSVRRGSMYSRAHPS